ncbi:hypothetical protein Hypma_010741 [Hypsizygus marmoreus]|uniref:Uncharacterized protein n=1 Tax=Hypsizygus marmoreus TaxID=39966 RepID=A0A369JJ47_HYPMA|nr:hypothetical protein Hypma_010741 [Hypsizygus marmoreus]
MPRNKPTRLEPCLSTGWPPKSLGIRRPSIMAFLGLGMKRCWRRGCLETDPLHPLLLLWFCFTSLAIMPTSIDDGPSSGHLSAAWEIALVAVIITLVFLVIGTTVVQIRRRQRRKRREMLDVESGRQKETPGGMSESQAKFEQECSVSMPKPTASSTRHSSTSSYPDHLSQKPPRFVIGNGSTFVTCIVYSYSHS